MQSPYKVLHFFFVYSMVHKIHSYTVIPSTNKIAFELAAAGASHGEIVRAESQSAGRGRLGKVWSSPPGKGLYFSIIVRPGLDRIDYPKLTITTGLAIAFVLDTMFEAFTLLKWPNDIILSGKKCGGILCEASLEGKTFEERFAIIGIGLNVLTQPDDFPADLRTSATSIALETGLAVNLDLLLNAIVKQVLSMIRELENDGFANILEQWKKRDFLKGKWLEWLTLKEEVIFAKAEGPDEEGRLLVRDKEGKLHQVLSGDVSLAGHLQKKGADRLHYDSSQDPALE